MKIGEAHRTRSSSFYSANTIGAPMHPAPIGVAVRTGKKICETKFEFYWHTVSGQHCLLAEGDIGAPLTVRCASPIFIPIAYYLGFTNRKRKYFEEKTKATLKSKQTSIATFRNHLRTLASSPTPLIFHWSLPLSCSCKFGFLLVSY